MLDYHLHLWPHGEPSRQPTLDEIAAYCEAAAARGITEVALTEHLFRFAQADAPLRGWWEEATNPALRAQASAYWAEYTRADLDAYVGAVVEAKEAGLPVVLGLEVDHYAGRMDRVGELLAGYPFDVLLGSVHWIAGWMFDVLDVAAVTGEWDARPVEAVWDEYARALEELAASGAVDVLAHPDLCKVTGRCPALPGEFHDRIAEAAATCGLAAEVSSAGWRKPCAEAYPAPPLLARLRERGVPITTASDAHHLGEVAFRAGDLRSLAAGAGYDSLVAFRSRRPVTVPL